MFQEPRLLKNSALAGMCGRGRWGQSPQTVWVQQWDTLTFRSTHLVSKPPPPAPPARTAVWPGRGRDHLPTHFSNGERRGAPRYVPPPSEKVSGTLPTWSSCLPWDMEKALANHDADSARSPGLKLHLESIFIKCIDRFRYWKLELSQKAFKMTQMVRIS